MTKGRTFLNIENFLFFSSFFFFYLLLFLYRFFLFYSKKSRGIANSSSTSRIPCKCIIRIAANSRSTIDDRSIDRCNAVLHQSQANVTPLKVHLPSFSIHFKCETYLCVYVLSHVSKPSSFYRSNTFKKNS